MFIKKSIALVLSLVIMVGLFSNSVFAVELPEHEFPSPDFYCGGASILTDKVSEQYNTQAIRIYYDFFVSDEGKIIIGNDELAVKERGVLIRADGKSDTPLTISNVGKGGVIAAKKTSNFNECWGYNADSGKLTFSVYVANLEKNDNRKISFRGYVVLENNVRYYTETVSVSVSDIKNS